MTTMTTSRTLPRLHSHPLVRCCPYELVAIVLCGAGVLYSLKALVHFDYSHMHAYLSEVVQMFRQMSWRYYSSSKFR